MKKIIIVGLSCVLLFGFSLSVFAADETNPVPTSDITDMQNLVDLIETLVNWFFAIIMIIAVFMLLFAAFNWLTSAGNEEKIGTARKMLIYALVGIAIALVSKGLIEIIKGLVGSQ